MNGFPSSSYHYKDQTKKNTVSLVTEELGLKSSHKAAIGVSFPRCEPVLFMPRMGKDAVSSVATRLASVAEEWSTIVIVPLSLSTSHANPH